MSAGETRTTWILTGLLGAALVWACAPALQAAVTQWSDDPRYSHGFLVPVFAGYLLWHRRDRIAGAALRPSWWGLGLIAFGAALKLVGTRYYVDWLDAVALPFWVAGLALAVGGWTALRWAWPAAIFLIFMIPLPFRVEQALGAPLQTIATKLSTFALQILGQVAVPEGNVIRLAGHRVNVAEACNGLGMLMMFLAYATGAALVVNRPWIDRLLLVASALPIAILANALRITVTGWLYANVGKGIGDAVYHDLAGWLMMPLALVMLGIALWILNHLFVVRAPEPAALPIWKTQIETGVHAVRKA